MTGDELLTSLRRGERILALGIRASRTAEVVRWAKAAGYHTIWIDMEHSTLPVDVVSQMCLCARDIGLMPWVRVPEREYGVINRVLDGGALGIVIARVESAEQAQAAATATRFAPHGQRSQISTLPVVDYARLPAREFNERVNAATALKVLIESRAGVAAADAIAAVDGVDVVALGCNDLSADMGYPGEPTHPAVVAACREVIAATVRHRKVAIVGGMPEGEALDSLRREGATRFVFAGIDSDLFLASLRERAEAARRAP
ncbi:aldolase/citrate lyase family protein [Paraburkholderia susongensis]|uniref:2-keto-3-deoxy-L-rhamnonate aldolase RhmA n=1 Tax=Paraburkholderia susongensis TaxID=1515439 RepID=A0A1X7LIE5_9BURK|nr:aldolase/citrate lyase family protein [Paraburkholderia susongensis]SMG53621.1 2-keto-3-deoxy-L-rhamnonate aldolase RhmA [Paraburkholderia susongensis]